MRFWKYINLRIDNLFKGGFSFFIMKTKEVVVLALVVYFVLILIGLVFWDDFDVELSPDLVKMRPSISEPVHMDAYVYHSCYDSDEEDYFVKGKVYGERSSRLSQYYPPPIESYEFWDACIDPATVEEWICGVYPEPQPVAVSYGCGSGYECYDGRCIESLPVCGNGVVEGDEVCDGEDLGGEDCVSQGYDGGTLACLPDCSGFFYLNCVVNNPVTGCVVLDSPGVYKMPSSIVNDGPSIDDHCISIRADGVTLNCLDHEIKNDQEKMIGVYSNSDDTVIENCRISMSFYNGTVYPKQGSKGIFLDGAGDAVVRNNYLWENSMYAIEVAYGPNAQIYDNYLTENNPGMFSDGTGIRIRSNSDYGTIERNVVERSRIGMYLSSFNLLVFNNTIGYNSESGLKTYGSGNLIENNLFYSNHLAIDPDRNAFYSDNSFLRNMQDLFISQWYSWSQYSFAGNDFDETIDVKLDFSSSSREVLTGENVDFSFGLNYPNGEFCPSCTYEVELYPPEGSLSYSSFGEEISGSFVPTEVGMYSLLIEIVDPLGNEQNRKYIYLVNGSEEREVTYVFRGFEPIHGQPHADSGGRDAGALLFSEPGGYEERRCASWIQFAPDEQQNDPYGIYEYLNFSIWYARANQSAGHDYLGFQEFGTFDYTNVDYATPYGVPPTYAGTQPDQGERFAFGEFYLPIGGVADYSTSWNWIALKLAAAFPAIKSEPGNVSRVTFGYLSSDTPAVLFVSNKLDVLAATSQQGGLDSAHVYVVGGGEMVVEMPEGGDYVAFVDGVECGGGDCEMTQISDKELAFEIEEGGVRLIEISLGAVPVSRKHVYEDRKLEIMEVP